MKRRSLWFFALVLSIYAPISWICAGQAYAQDPEASPRKATRPRSAETGRASRVIRNSDLSTLSRARVSQSRSAPAQQATGSNAEASSGAGGSAPTDQGGPDSAPNREGPFEEADWQRRFLDARLRVRMVEEKELVLQLKYNELRNRFFVESDGSTRGLIEQQMSEALTQIEENRIEAAGAMRDLEKLETLARSQGVPEAWTREAKTPTPPPGS